MLFRSQGDVASKAITDLVGSLASKGISFNPIRLIESFSETSPEVAKRMVTRLLSVGGDKVIDSMVTNGPDVVKTISYLEQLFGSRSRPMVSRIVERAEMAGISSAAFAPYKASPAMPYEQQQEQAQ